jgi:hypothetical protein
LIPLPRTTATVADGAAVDLAAVIGGRRLGHEILEVGPRAAVELREAHEDAGEQKVDE